MIRHFDAPDLPLSMQEVRRYAQLKDSASQARLNDLLPEALAQVQGRVCYDLFPVKMLGGGRINLGFSVVSSHSLCHLLRHASQCVVFAATIGLAYDRHMARISKCSAADGWLLHALGTERVESLCDAFEQHLKAEGFFLTRRFSPGYGDVPLTLQRDLFCALDCPRQIGLTLNDSLLMSPSKSVTAIIGLTEAAEPATDRCASCTQLSCAFRS